MILDEIIDSTDNVRDVSSKLTNKIGVFILKIEKKILNLKYNILWLKINLKMILLELYAV